MIIEDATQKSAIKLNSDNMGLIWNDTLSEFHQFWEMTINYTNHALVQTAAMIQQHPQSKRNIKRQKHRLFSDDDGCGPQSERRYLLLPTDEQIDIEENQLFGNNV
ncbi:hypothetical protein BLOT_004631 [Blomia tropicalis]|nr:hypothetical protein BLOT_004631 [Blomia tropicalis]